MKYEDCTPDTIVRIKGRPGTWRIAGAVGGQMMVLDEIRDDYQRGDREMAKPSKLTRVRETA